MTVYFIETPKEILWSKRKMDRDYKHAIDFLFRDRAKARELTQERFNRLKTNTGKKVYEIV